MERPIIFSTPMVQAILKDRKTQTRRIVKPQPRYELSEHYGRWNEYGQGIDKETGSNWGYGYICRYGNPGDVLWVRETWCYGKDTHAISFDPEPLPGDIIYKADIGEVDKEIVKWRPSIFMPREAARIFLIVKNIRVERLQDISEEDAIAEGVTHKYGVNRNGERTLEKVCTTVFRELWDNINKARGYGWDKNPLVWVVEFEVKEVRT